MTSVTLRFYGRFLYAEKVEGTTTKKISAIAPKFEKNQKHRPFMIVQRQQLVYGVDGTMTSGRAPIRTVSGLASKMPDIAADELFMWDLSGLRVTYGLSGQVSLTVEPDDAHAAGAGASHAHARRELLDLAELERLRGGSSPEFDEDALEPNGHSNAVVELTAGEGRARAIPQHDGKIGKIRLARAKHATEIQDPGQPNDRFITEHNEIVEFEPADLIEFKLDVADDHLTFFLEADDPDESGKVSVEPGSLVAFSNLLCGSSEPMPADLEFSQYYELLKQEPPEGEELIPIELSHSMAVHASLEGSDCDLQARLKYPKS
jgi:hypothetical protein